MQKSFCEVMVRRQSAQHLESMNTLLRIEAAVAHVLSMSGCMYSAPWFPYHSYQPMHEDVANECSAPPGLVEENVAHRTERRINKSRDLLHS